jgi:hypothetical protein
MNKYIYGIFFFLFVLGLFLLNNFKAVWVDETYMAEITYQLMNGNGFHTQADYVSTNGFEQLIYGPVYFGITSFFVWLGGLNPFWFRLANYLAFTGVVLLMLRYLKTNKDYKWLWLAPIILFLDNSGFDNSVSGRMEAISLLFALITYLTHSSPRLVKKWYYPFLMGVTISIAYLNTPRSAILFIPLAFHFLKDLFKARTRSYVLITGAVFLSILSLWVFGKHGGVQEYIDFYTNNKNFHTNTRSPVEEYLFGNFKLSKFQIILLSLLFFSFILPKKLSSRDWYLNIHFTIISAIFLVVVNDFGAYFSIISPILTFLIVLNFSKVIKWQKVRNLALIAFLLFNVSIFSIKNIYNLVNNNKEYSPIDELVKKHIPDGSRVVFDYEFFYPLRNKNVDAYFFQIGKHARERVDFHINEVDPQYLLTNKNDSKIKLYDEHYSYRIIAEYPNKVNKYQWIIDKYLKKLGGSFFDVDYKDLVIFELNKKNM